MLRDVLKSVTLSLDVAGWIKYKEEQLSTETMCYNHVSRRIPHGIIHEIDESQYLSYPCLYPSAKIKTSVIC